MDCQYKSFKTALEHLRKAYFGRKLSYREMAELLTAYSGREINKSHVWNARYRSKRCPKDIRAGLENIGLLQCRPKRWRFFFEVDEEEYSVIEQWLQVKNITFTQYMKERGGPWVV